LAHDDLATAQRISGRRWRKFSHEAVVKLKKKGFEARRLKLGFPDWCFAGLPVETGQSE
jgi:hypothetical protein